MLSDLAAMLSDLAAMLSDLAAMLSDFARLHKSDALVLGGGGGCAISRFQEDYDSILRLFRPLADQKEDVCSLVVPLLC